MPLTALAGLHRSVHLVTIQLNDPRHPRDERSDFLSMPVILASVSRTASCTSRSTPPSVCHRWPYFNLLAVTMQSRLQRPDRTLSANGHRNHPIVSALVSRHCSFLPSCFGTFLSLLISPLLGAYGSSSSVLQILNFVVSLHVGLESLHRALLP